MDEIQYRPSLSPSGSNALRGKIAQQAIVVDPAGAIIISVYIILAWIRQANRKSCAQVFISNDFCCYFF